MRHCCAAVTACSFQSSCCTLTTRHASSAKRCSINEEKKMDWPRDPTPGLRAPPTAAAAVSNLSTRRLVNRSRVYGGLPWPSRRAYVVPGLQWLIPAAVPYYHLQPVRPFFAPCYLNSRTSDAVPDMDLTKHSCSPGKEDDIMGANKRARTNNYATESCVELLQCHHDGQLTSSRPSPVFQLKLDKKSIEMSVKALEMANNRLRTWEFTDVGRKWLKYPASNLGFTLMSYNVLAQCLLEDNRYLYDHCHPDVLRWDYRKERLLAEFRLANADILCLQEVQNEHFDGFFVPELEKLGYSGIYKKRTGNKNDGCAIFYRNAVFVLDSSISVEFCRPGVGVLDRDNIALVATLHPKDSEGAKFCVANTHLLFNPGRGDIKLAQLRVLLAEIDRIAFHRLSHKKRPLYHPVILCGDMNSEPECPLYRFVGTGALHYEGLVAGDVSGQAEGMFRGRFLLNKELVPPTLGISDQCQYVETVSQRMGGLVESEQPVGEADRTEEMAASSRQLSNSDSCLAPSANRRLSFSSGKMTHRLNLMSAYQHHLDRLPDRPPAVTTHHRKASCTVDYIFYSMHSKHSATQHSHARKDLLVLLATYGLLSENEVRDLGGLPNAAQPSDHLPLVAKFMLRKS